MVFLALLRDNRDLVLTRDEALPRFSPSGSRASTRRSWTPYFARSRARPTAERSAVP
jgi:hypothetical protein